MAQWRYYTNLAVPDTLAAGINNSATSIVAGSGAPVGYPSQFPWTLRLDPNTSSEELVSVSSGAGTSGTPWVVVRGYDGTTAKSHSSDAGIQHGMSAGDLTMAALHYAMGSGSGVHGLPASAWSTAALANLQDTTLANSSTSVVTFSSIPQTYSHLLLVAQGRLTETTDQANDALLTFNGDTAARYANVTWAVANPSGSIASGTGNAYASSSTPVFRFLASQAGSNVNAGGGFAFIPNYANAAFNKLVYSLSGGGNGTTSLVDMRTRIGIYNPVTQAAVTSLSLAAAAGNYLTGTRFTLYGIA